MANNVGAQQHSLAMQKQYRTAHDRRRVWYADMDAAAAVEHWFGTPSLRPADRRVELLELQEMAERLMDQDLIKRVDPALAERLNRELVIAAHDVVSVDPLSAGLAETVAESLFRARCGLRLEELGDQWLTYRSDVLHT